MPDPLRRRITKHHPQRPVGGKGNLVLRAPELGKSPSLHIDIGNPVQPPPHRTPCSSGLRITPPHHHRVQ